MRPYLHCVVGKSGGFTFQIKRTGRSYSANQGAVPQEGQIETQDVVAYEIVIRQNKLPESPERLGFFVDAGLEGVIRFDSRHKRLLLCLMIFPFCQ